MSNLNEAAQRMFDLFEAAAARGESLCNECRHPVESANETELLPGGRCHGTGAAEFCRRCWLALFAFAPNCEGI